MTPAKSMPDSGRRPHLTVPCSEAEEKLMDRIAIADSHLLSPIRDRAELESRWAEYQIWSDYNLDLLRMLFTDDSCSVEYNKRTSYAGLVATSHQSFAHDVEVLQSHVKTKRNSLESIKGRLSLFPESITDAASTTDELLGPRGSTIFLVHGHDSGMKQTVARTLEKLHLDVVILHEQPSQGKTIIEKFEHHSENAGFAVVLLTPDDVGRVKDEGAVLRARARQNVILELGYFLGKLGRSRVAVLYSEGIELPSDILGVLYVMIDEREAWQTHLAKELSAAGLPVDLNDLK